MTEGQTIWNFPLNEWEWHISSLFRTNFHRVIPKFTSSALKKKGSLRPSSKPFVHSLSSSFSLKARFEVVQSTREIDDYTFDEEVALESASISESVVSEETDSEES